MFHTTGLHHLTAIASDPQRNLDFYAGTLGLRFVKQTVNFDDPGTYHLYYGDATGRPGSILTFFPWPGARRGRVGVGQVAETQLAIPTSALAFWIQRLNIRLRLRDRRDDSQQNRCSPSPITTDCRLRLSRPTLRLHSLVGMVVLEFRTR
jgi:catechol 2,3-dioxygenase-like lactoylglutathione lyase family enzyme